MKTLVILIFTLFTTLTSIANTAEPIATALEGQTVTVFFDNNKSETVSVSIIDKSGFVLLTDKVETKNRKSRGYNLEQLPYGVYTIEIDSDQKIVYQTIKTDKHNSTVLNEEVAYKPTSFFENNRWKLNLLSLGQNVKVQIYDAEFEPIFAEKYNDEKVIAKSYDLSNLEYGMYTLSVMVGGNVYNKVVAKM